MIIGEDLIATLLEPGCFLTDTVGYLLAKEPYSITFILALFQSKLIEWHFGLFSTTNHVNAYEVQTLPIPKIQFVTHSDRREKFQKQFQEIVLEKNKDSVLRFIEDRLATTHQESDVIHDLLAFLAERMLELNKQKQAEMKRLIGWLEGMLKVSVNELTGRSKVRNYIGDYQKDEPELTFAELDDILFDNNVKVWQQLAPHGKSPRRV